MKKKIFSIIVCSILLLGITGCGAEVNKQDNQNNKIENNSSVKDNNQEDENVQSENTDRYLVFSKNENISKTISLNNKNYSIKISDDGFDLEIYNVNDSKTLKGTIEGSNSNVYLYKNHIIALQSGDYYHLTIYNSNIKNIFESSISDNKLVFENNNIFFSLNNKQYIYDLSNEEYKEK